VQELNNGLDDVKKLSFARQTIETSNGATASHTCETGHRGSSDVGRAACDIAGDSVNGSDSPIRRLMRRKHIARVLVSIVALLMLGGCGLFGCGGATSNGGGWGGCHVGTRF